MADTFLSLDIDAVGIAAMIVTRVSKKSYVKKICRINYKDLPETQKPENLLDSALIYLEDHMDMASCSVATLLIPSSSVSFRNIELPFRSAKKIKQILPIEITSHLPVPEEKYISDFHILNSPYKKDQVPVFTASIIESVIENYIDALSQYGIKPKIITPKGYAAAICLLKKIPSITNFICLDLGLCENTITLVHHREPVFVRSFSALQYKAEEFADTVKQALLGFRQTTGSDTCFDLFITAGNGFKDLEKVYYALENLLDYQTRYQQSDDSSQHKPELKKINSTNLISALHPNKKTGPIFNFYKIKTESDPIFRKNIKAIATIIFLACILFASSRYNLHLEIADLNEKIDNNQAIVHSIYKTSFPEEKNIKHPFLQMQSLVKKAIKESNSAKKNEASFIKSNHKAARVMAALSDSIPRTIDMEISRFLLNRTTLVISGTTDNFKNVDRIKSFIEKADLFKQISINSASADKKTDQVLFKFTIQLQKGAL
ncbi:MAG: hypothetical protein K8S13_15430 [Desulfobacula sp.]|uniref:PilN domain-containing protein n=1 Tax=Desulfobacula sp. TaxID=2593537 RepID=UPI0025BFDA2A|nr:PilN domain-containing protein [Desulfobacula sp.]MCD4721231.1 hypothetical protein [Desulfobacula sp.]